MTGDVMGYVLQMVKDERARQDAKWGPRTHDLPWWSVILGEEYGEACKAIYEATTSRNPHGTAALSDGSPYLCDVRDELVQVAAVAVAALEDLLRHEERSASAWRQLPL